MSVNNTPHYQAASPAPDLSEPYEAPILSIAGETYKPGLSSDFVIKWADAQAGWSANQGQRKGLCSRPFRRSGGITLTLSSLQPQSTSFLTIDGSIYPEDSASNFVVGPQTRVSDSSPVSINQYSSRLDFRSLGWMPSSLGSRASYLSLPYDEKCSAN